MSGTEQTYNAFRKTINSRNLQGPRTSYHQSAGYVRKSGYVRRGEKGMPDQITRRDAWGRIMPRLPDVPLTSIPLTAIERPRCGRCLSRMMLARIAPLPDGSERRTFECPKCESIETMTVADPLKSEAVARLTANIRPPV